MVSDDLSVVISLIPILGLKSSRAHPFLITAETKRFYVALSIIGTDFSLMVKFFQNRDRTELKVCTVKNLF